MATVNVHIKAQGRRPVKGQLTTDHPSSSYGEPVLMLDGGRSFPPGQLVPHAPGDVSHLGISAFLDVRTAEPDPDRLLPHWRLACATWRARWGRWSAEDTEETGAGA